NPALVVGAHGQGGGGDAEHAVVQAQEVIAAAAARQGDRVSAHRAVGGRVGGNRRSRRQNRGVLVIDKAAIGDGQGLIGGAVNAALIVGASQKGSRAHR